MQSCEPTQPAARLPIEGDKSSPSGLLLPRYSHMEAFSGTRAISLGQRPRNHRHIRPAALKARLNVQARNAIAPQTQLAD